MTLFTDSPYEKMMIQKPEDTNLHGEITGVDGYNGDLTSDVSATLGTNCGMSTGRNGVLDPTPFVNNQQDEARFTCGIDGDLALLPPESLHVSGLITKGNSDCFITEEKHTTLSTGGGQAGQGYPCIFAAGFSAGAGATAGSIGYDEEIAPTLKGSASGNCMPTVFCLNDQGGIWMNVTEEYTNTLRAEAHHPPVIAEVSGSVFENHGADARYKGPLSVNPSLTAQYGTGGNNQPLVLQGGSDEEKKTYDVRQTSDGTRNMRNHVYESDTCRTVDRSGNVPGSNQGGIAVVELTYSASKNSHFTRAAKEVASSLVATDYKDPPLINSHARVRRLMPAECARLQGFPDWWCSGLATENPTEEDIRFWQDVFETHRKALGKTTKPKTRNQIVKWLLNPYRDSAEYKMWGNGVALPCVWFVLSGIAYFFQDTGTKSPE